MPDRIPLLIWRVEQLEREVKGLEEQIGDLQETLTEVNTNMATKEGIEESKVETQRIVSHAITQRYLKLQTWLAAAAIIIGVPAIQHFFHWG